MENSPKDAIPEWAKGDELLEWYATKIWGKRNSDDNSLFEVMCLQVFQAGLSWRQILLRRNAFRKAFNDWQIDHVANLSPRQIDQLINNASIIRNRKKIESCVENAKIVRHIQQQYGSFCRWFYDELEGDDLASLQRILRRTFKFIGPEIARMWLMASGRIPA